MEKKHIFFSTWPNRSSYSSFGKLISIFLRHSETSLVVQLQMLFDTLNKFGAIKSDSRSWNPWRTNPSSYVYIVLRRMKLTSAPISSLPYRNNCPENIRYFFWPNSDENGFSSDKFLRTAVIGQEKCVDSNNRKKPLKNQIVCVCVFFCNHGNNINLLNNKDFLDKKSKKSRYALQTHWKYIESVWHRSSIFLNCFSVSRSDMTKRKQKTTTNGKKKLNK